MNIEELKKEYTEQDNAFTAYPTYVQVQELRGVGVLADGYSASCPFGDDEIETKYSHSEYEGWWDSKGELVKKIQEDSPEKWKGMVYDIEELNVGYIWHPVEFFLTIKGAKEYMKTNSHNHGRLRTYIMHFERRNFEMRGLLKELGFKTED